MTTPFRLSTSTWPDPGVSPGLPENISLPLLAGRDFDERDGLDKPLAVLVSKSTARRLFPGEEPIGKRICPSDGINDIGMLAEVVGVVGDVRSSGWIEENDVEFYRPCRTALRPLHVGRGSRGRTTRRGRGSLVQSALKRLDPASLSFSPAR